LISGYLICGMIDADLRRGTFSLANFAKRRGLRILPALFVMFLVTSGLAYVYCLPVELEQYARSLASAAIQVEWTRVFGRSRIHRGRGVRRRSAPAVRAASARRRRVVPLSGARRQGRGVSQL